MSESIQTFLKAQLDGPAQWKDLKLEDYLSPLDERFPDSVVPMYGAPHFSDLSDKEKQTLAKEFMRFNAEALIVLEQALLLGMRSHEKNLKKAGLRPAAHKLAREEYFHIRGFRQFLAKNNSFEWRKNDHFLFRNKRCRKWLARLARWQPTALCLPGAKIEAYSLGYSHYIREAFGGWEKNQWTKIHHLHFLDEAFHVSVQFEIYTDSYSSGWRAVKLAVGMLGFIGLLQILLMVGNWRMIAASMPERSFFTRILWTIRMARWTVRSYAPYGEARIKMRRLLARPGLPMGKLFSFMAW